MLTGATGFLGVFLLEALQGAESTPVWCVVRCRSEAEGRARLLERARFFGATIDASRVEIIPGDVSEPRLGLSESWRRAILREVKHVYHSAAQVDFLRGYPSLKAANVMSVVELGRLTLDAPGMHLHFVSSRNVLDLVGGGIEERMRQPWHDRLNDGYAQSKWVAEQVVVALHERGVPCAIYRPSRIVAARRSRGVNVDEFFNRALRASARLGLEPGYSGVDNMVPVDHVARAIVALSQMDACLGGAFHVQHPRETSLSLVLDRLRHRLALEGRTIDTSGPREWIAAIEGDDPAHQPLFALLPLLRVDASDAPAAPPAPVPSGKTDELLRSLGIECPAIDEAHVDRLIALALT
nr:thioester reductase domain-containing protein [Luteibacter sp. Sphag1AF]